MAILKKKYVVPIILTAIILVGAFLRLYHFSDYLHFELDQARDTIFVSEAVKNGLIELPLLGAKASGTALRVGPAYYYLEYISALIFGNTPIGHALFVALFSIASIYVFYLLLKRFFNEFISLGLTYLYSISLFFVLYSRFSWNPNILPFVIIAGIYSLLRATDGKSRRPERWFVGTVLLFTIGTQLHFIAFVALPILAFIFLAYKRPKFSWKTWVASIFLILVLYAPVIANEIKFHGENTQAFFASITKKNNVQHNIVEKLIQNTLSESEGYALMLSGDDHIVTPKLNLRANHVSISCADYCHKTPTWKSILAILFFIGGSLLLLWRAYKTKNELALLGSWLVITFLIFTTLAYELPARFYLLVTPLPFIFLGILIQLLWQKNAMIAKIVFLTIIVLLSYSNFSFLAQRFSQLSQAGSKIIRIPSDNILEEPTRVTLAQQEKVAQFLQEKYAQNGYPINVIYAEPFYRRSIKYLADSLGVPIAPMDKNAVYLHSNAVIVLRSTNKGEGIFNQYLTAYDIQAKTEFGTLTVYSLAPKPEKITGDTPTPAYPAGGDTGDILRITWRDLFK